MRMLAVICGELDAAVGELEGNLADVIFPLPMTSGYCYESANNVRSVSTDAFDRTNMQSALRLERVDYDRWRGLLAARHGGHVRHGDLRPRPAMLTRQADFRAQRRVRRPEV